VIGGGGPAALGGRPDRDLSPACDPASAGMRANAIVESAAMPPTSVARERRKPRPLRQSLFDGCLRLAYRDRSSRRSNSDAIGGIADIGRKSARPPTTRLTHNVALMEKFVAMHRDHIQ
jgi:hypothetical protein